MNSQPTPGEVLNGEIAAELERLAECEGGVRGGSPRAAETMRQAAKLIREAASPSEQPEPVAWLSSRLIEVEYLDGNGETHMLPDEVEWADAIAEIEIARLSSPIGLDLGARTPEETAVSIAAEVIQQRWGGRGQRLTELGGPIHHGVSR